jgi:hypothetical protein
VLIYIMGLNISRQHVDLIGGGGGTRTPDPPIMMRDFPVTSAIAMDGIKIKARVRARRNIEG